MKEFIKSNLLDSKGRLNSNISKNPEKWFIKYDFVKEYELILAKTNFMNIDVKFSDRIYAILNDIEKYKICRCGKPIIRMGKNSCSEECNKKNPDRIKNSINGRIKKYGYHYVNSEQSLKTRKEKYGNQYNNIEKTKKTCIERYGVESPLEIKSIKDKGYEIRRKNQINRLIEKFQDYECINEEKIEFRCKKCNKIIKLDNTKYHTNIIRCYDCNPHSTSLAENEIKKWLDELDIKIINNRKLIDKKYEIDIFIPNYNLAIEYNGLYWHSEQIVKDKNYHLYKTEKCQEQEIKLLHIFENEWLDPIKQDIWKSIIKSNLGLNEKIGARKCQIRELTNKECNKFLDQNHLQGTCQASIKLGLIYENDILSVLTLAKPRFNKNYDWEIVRYANKKNLNTVGGFSRLLHFFRKYYSGSIITYADKRYSNGDLYRSNGFIELKDSTPNYWYVKGDQLYSRIQFQKHKLEYKLENFNINLTESENMFNNGYRRIWDCGNKVFVLK